jgi:tripartite-type tricarboxylate transporter receptor subunit TctC
MITINRRRLLMTVTSALGFAAAGAARAASDVGIEYPTRPVRIVVPFAPGGIADVMARLLAQNLSAVLGKQFVVENRAGAGSNIGTALVAGAAPDGHMLLLTTSAYVVNPSLMAQVPYNPDRDFAPITVAAVSPNLLVVHPSLPVHSVQELITYVRTNPGVASFASPGVGTTPHLAGEMFRLALKLDMVHVPFNGAGPAIQSTVAGHTPIAFASAPPAMPQVKAGALRALAVTSARRAPALPDVPTMAESGLADQESETIVPILAPAATPKAIIDLLYREIAKAIALPDTQRTLDELGFTALVSSPDDTQTRLDNEIARWAKVVRDAKIGPI